MSDEIKNETNTTEENTEVKENSNEADNNQAKTPEEEKVETIAQVKKDTVAEWEKTNEITSTDDNSGKGDDIDKGSDGKPEEPPEVEEEKNDEEVSVIPQVLVDKAQALGLTYSEIQEMKNVNELLGVIGVLDRQPQPEIKEEKKEEPEENPIDAVFDKLDKDEDLDPDLKEGMKLLREEFKRQSDKIKGLEKQSVTGQTQKQRESDLAHEKAFDAEINSLGEDAKLLLGEGDINSLKRGSKEENNRFELFKTVDALGHSYAARNQKVPELGKLIDLAGHSLWGDSFKTEKTEIKKKLDKQSQILINKPGQRKAVETQKSGQENAVDAVKEWMDKKTG